MSHLNIKNKKVVSGTVGLWNQYKEKNPNTAQFLVFFMLSNGVTVLQLVLMPAFKSLFAKTELVTTSFQVLQFGQNFDGSPYYVFDYAAGALASGGGGGLAYFLAVQITIGIAQVINFFAQRNITFKSNTNIWTAAFWYLVAYIVITIGAAAAQGFYKAPIYNLFMNTWGMGSVGETTADVITMIINSAISFWVFFPIFKIIFKQKPETQA
jgi:putative flippase GtrA